MKKYHLYGIGNALVDIDFEIDIKTLTDLNIDKGVMTLIDEQRHHELLQHLDGKQKQQICGGSAGNTVVASAQFGSRCFYSCKVANDPTGDFYLQDLIQHGVDTNLSVDNRPQGHTGKCIVLVTHDADRTMNTHLGITATLSTAEINAAAIADSEYLYIEGFLVSSNSALEAAIEAKNLAEQYHVKTSLTLSDQNMTDYFSDQLRTVIGSGVDLLFCNEAEALSFCKTDQLSDALSSLEKMAKQFVVTLGAKGSLIFDGQQYLEIPVIKTKPIDTVGAGDMYAGALLYGLTHGYDLVDAGMLASHAAAHIVAKIGPRLATDEATQILNHTEQQRQTKTG